MSLHLLGASNFQRVEGLSSGCSKGTAHRLLFIFETTVRTKKSQFLYLPSQEQMEANARAIYSEY